MPAHASYPENLTLRMLKARREYELLKEAAHHAVDIHSSGRAGTAC